MQQLQALRQRAGLMHLDIIGTALQRHSAEEGHQAAVVELGASLQGMRSLTCLHLQFWKLQSATAVTTLASALQLLTQLQHLHISRLGAARVAALTPALSGMRGLETLDVCNNPVNGAEGAMALCTLLDAVPGLTHLDVNSDRLWDEGAALLAPVLRGMTCLQTLNLNDTGTS